MDRRPGVVLDRLHKAFDILRREDFYTAPGLNKGSFAKTKQYVQDRAKASGKQFSIFWALQDQLNYEQSSGGSDFYLCCVTASESFSSSDERLIEEKVKNAFACLGIVFEWNGRLLYKILIKGVRHRRDRLC